MTNYFNQSQGNLLQLITLLENNSWYNDSIQSWLALQNLGTRF